MRPLLLASLALPLPACGAHSACAPAPHAAAGGVATAPPAPLATPGPAAASCADDSTCGTHRCNTSERKCAFPCASDTDCVAGASCIHGAAAICLSAKRASANQ